MIKPSSLNGLLILLFLLGLLRATGEENVSLKDRLFFFFPKTITIKNVCEDQELLGFDVFMPRNMFLYFKGQTNNGIIGDYQNYYLALQKHKDIMTNYLQNLEAKMATYNDQSLTVYQIDYVRAKIQRITSYIQTIVRETNEEHPDYVFYSGEDIAAFSDSYDRFLEESQQFDNMNSDYVFNLFTLIKEAATNDFIRQAIQPAVCNNVIGSIIDIFTSYLNEQKFSQLAQEKQALLIKFFNQFNSYSFEAYECDEDDAKNHLINQIYKIIYNKDLEAFDPSEFGYFLTKIIPNTPTSDSTDFHSIKKMDHDIVHTFEKYHSLNLDDLRNMYKLRKPISIDFIRFLNNAEQELDDLNIRVNNIEQDDVPLDVFLIIYKTYIIGRSELPEDQDALFDPLDGVDEKEDISRIAKRLFFFLLQTDVFQQTDFDGSAFDTELDRKTLFNQFMGPIKFRKYKLLVLLTLLKKFSLNPLDFTTPYLQNFLDLLDDYNDPSEFVKSADLPNYLPAEFIDKYHNQQVERIFNDLDNKKQHIRNQLNNYIAQNIGKKPNRRKQLELQAGVLNTEIENMADMLDISDPLENPAAIKNKAVLLTNLVEKVDDEVDRYTAINVVTKALHTNVLKKVPNQADSIDKKKLLANILIKMNNKLVSDLLLKINTTGLYQFLTYISTQANQNDIMVLGRNQKNSSDPDRANNFTLDKLIFLHKWHEIKKTSLNNRRGNEDYEETREDKIFKTLIGPSDHHKSSLSIVFNKKKTDGFKQIYQHFLLTSMFIEYYPSLKFMANLIPLFDRFSSIEHENPNERIHETYKEMFVTLYNVILDIRSGDLEMKGRTAMEIFLEKLHEIRDDLLEAHMTPNNEKVLTARHSMTYKDVAKVSYFVYYHIALDLENEQIFEEQINGNFGNTELIARDTEALKNTYQPQQLKQFLHSRFDFGGIAFEASNFLTYIYIHDREFIRNKCVVNEFVEGESNIKTNGFCAQAMIFMNSMDFLSRKEAANFGDWIEHVFGNQTFKEYVLQNKGILYSSLEMINRESNMLRTMHTERLSKIIDDEEARVLEIDSSDEPTDYEMFFKLDVAKDKSWLINYMFVNFERVYSQHEKILFEAFSDIVKNELLDDYVGSIKKIYYSDLELEAKSFNVEAFRVLLLFTQDFYNFEKIADYVMKHNRSTLLIYLKKENDNTSSVINTLKNRIVEDNITDKEQAKPIIKEIFNQYASLLIEQCQDDILQDLSGDNLEDFGDILGLLGDPEPVKQNTFKIEINQESVMKALKQEVVALVADKEASVQQLKKKGIRTKLNLQINLNEGETEDLKVFSGASEDDSLLTKMAEKTSTEQINMISIGNMINGMMRSSTVVENKKQSNLPVNNIASRRKSFIKTMKTTYESIKKNQSGSQVDLQNEFLLI